MPNAAGKSYRTVTRKTAIAVMALVIGVSALAVWFGLNWVELYSDRMSQLIDSSPDQARAKMMRDSKLIACATGATTSALAAFMFWYGLKSLRTQSVPPKASWVVEGQRIRTGPDAVFHAKLILVMSAILCLLGIVAAAMLWRLPSALLAN